GIFVYAYTSFVSSLLVPTKTIEKYKRIGS
ncbi:unnamed protein product, partial [marine sediment metagenome]